MAHVRKGDGGDIGYKTANWTPLGLTQGNQRVARDYYEPHDLPKMLFVRELAGNARRSLQAEHLKPALAALETAAPPRCTRNGGEQRRHRHRLALPTLPRLRTRGGQKQRTERAR